MDDRREELARPDASDDARPDEAVFDVRVADTRRAPIPVLVLALAVAAVVGAGILGRGSAPDEARLSIGPAATAGPTTVRPFASEPGAARASSTLDVETRTSGRLVLVHAEVFTIDAVVVIVSLVDTADSVLEIVTVDMPGGSTALRTGANDRFDLAFRLADARTPAWVEANAYDRIGRRIAWAREPVQVPFEPMRSRFGAGT